MAIIDTRTPSFSRRLAAALGLSLCVACTTAEPADAGPTVAPAEIGERPASDSLALEDAIGAWKASCATPGLDGLCVVKRAHTTPPPCKRSLLDLEVVSRSREAEDAHDVLDGLVGDVDEFTRGPFEPGEVEAMGNAVLAHFDAGIERHMAAKLDAKAHVEEWLYDGERLITGLASIKRFGSPAMNVRAAWRTALLYAAAHDRLANAAGEQPDAAVCAELAEFVAPVAALALNAATWCVDQATEHDVRGPSVDRCRTLVHDLTGGDVETPKAPRLRARE